MPAYQNLVQLIRERAAADPDRPALLFCRDAADPAGDDVLSYAQLDGAARRAGALLRERFAPGDRLLVVSKSAHGFAVSFLGCLYAGTIAVPAPAPDGYQRQRGRLAAIARDAGAAGVLADTADRADVEAWAKDADLAGLKVIAAADAGGPAAAGAWQAPSLTAGSLAFLQYTSGSTSSPKGVMVDHGNILANAEAFARIGQLTAGTRFGGWLPMYHDFGLIGLLIVPLYLGAQSTLMTPGAFLRRPHSWLQLISRRGLNFSPAPNFAYDLCVRRITDEELSGVDLSSWTHAVNGSEPIQARTLTSFRDRFAAAGLRPATLTPGYGLAEATLVVSGSAPWQEPVIVAVDAQRLGRGEFSPVLPGQDPGPAGPRELVSSGIMPDTVRIVDAGSGATRPDGQIGEVWVRGPSVTRGYWRDEERTRGAFGAVAADGTAGFLRTGDLGTSYDGELYVTGRIKELLIVRGGNLYPQDIEAAARAAHPALARGVGAAFTVEAPDEQVVIVHECRPARRDAATLTEISRRLTDVVTREFGAPVAGVVLVRPGSVPRTTSGKIQRALARRQFLDGQLELVHADLAPALRRATAAVRPQGDE